MAHQKDGSRFLENESVTPEKLDKSSKTTDLTNNTDYVAVKAMVDTFLSLMNLVGVYVVRANVPDLANVTELHGVPNYITFIPQNHQRFYLVAQDTASENGLYEFHNGTLTKVAEWKDVQPQTGLEINGQNLLLNFAQITANLDFAVITQNLTLKSLTGTESLIPLLQRDTDGLFAQLEIHPDSAGILSIKEGKLNFDMESFSGSGRILEVESVIYSSLEWRRGQTNTVNVDLRQVGFFQEDYTVEMLSSDYELVSASNLAPDKTLTLEAKPTLTGNIPLHFRILTSGMTTEYEDININIQKQYLNTYTQPTWNTPEAYSTHPSTGKVRGYNESQEIITEDSDVWVRMNDQSLYGYLALSNRNRGTGRIGGFYVDGGSLTKDDFPVVYFSEKDGFNYEQGVYIDGQYIPTTVYVIFHYHAGELYIYTSYNGATNPSDLRYQKTIDLTGYYVHIGVVRPNVSHNTYNKSRFTIKGNWELEQFAGL